MNKRGTNIRSTSIRDLHPPKIKPLDRSRGVFIVMVGILRFELRVFCSQSRRGNQAALYPERSNIMRIEEGKYKREFATAERKKLPSRFGSRFPLARQTRFELVTHRFVVCYSIQLSYWRI